MSRNVGRTETNLVTSYNLNFYGLHYDVNIDLANRYYKFGVFNMRYLYGVLLYEKKGSLGECRGQRFFSFVGGPFNLTEFYQLLKDFVKRAGLKFTWTAFGTATV